MIDWLVNHLPKCFLHINWEGLSDHAHYVHPLDRHLDDPPQPPF